MKRSIRYFSFNNFGSFKNEVKVSFEAPPKDEKDTRFFKAQNKKSLSKFIVAMGANGSGKTTLLKGLTFLAYFARDSFVEPKKSAGILYDPFIFTSNWIASESLFEIVFEVDEIKYQYILKLTTKRVLEEILNHWPKGRRANLFTRTWDESNKKSTLISKISEFKVLSSSLKENVSFMSLLCQTDHPKTQIVSQFFESLNSNLTYIPDPLDEEGINLKRLVSASAYFEKHNNDFEFLKEIMCNIDIGFADISIKKDAYFPGNPNKFPLPYGIHKVENKMYPLPFPLESSGTQNLFKILRFIIPTLKKGGIAIIDELDTALHVHMIPMIFELFYNESSNPYNSQLICSMQNPFSLHECSKDQIILVEKDEDCQSYAWRLDSVKKVRRDQNIVSKYLSGTYGAVPNITR